VIGLNDAVTKLDFLKNLIISMLASIATWLPTASKKMFYEGSHVSSR